MNMRMSVVGVVQALLWLALFGTSLVGPSAAAALPSVRLRTRTLRLDAERLEQQRRLLAKDAVQPLEHHTTDEWWGALPGRQQFLLTHRPGLAAEQQAELQRQVAQAGCHAAGLVPEHTLLLVGPPGAAAALARSTHVLHLAPLEADDKVAPEWQAVLQQVEQLLPRLEQTRQQGRGSASVEAAVEEAAAALQVAVEWDGARQALMVGALVTFPRRMAGIPAHTSKQQMQQQSEDAGAAAEADWGPLLGRLFGARVRRGGASSALVLAPAQQLPAVLDWLAQRPAVQWVAPAAVARTANWQAAAVVQSGRGPPEAPAADGATSAVDPGIYPLWAANITGAGQVIGIGDTGLDYRHCFFADPGLEWEAGTRVQDRVRVFDSPQHRKIRYYRAFGDTRDDHGHGTHVAGTLAGLVAGTSLEEEVAKGANSSAGMAPAAKLAVFDLGLGPRLAMVLPSELGENYFGFTTAVGAMVHSNSWTTASTSYDEYAAQLDWYAYNNPDVLIVFAAGNFGNRSWSADSKGDFTVTSPGLSKNALAVGATQTLGETSPAPGNRTVLEATLTVGGTANTFKVLQAFGPSGEALVGGAPLALARPLPANACEPLQNAAQVKGTILLMSWPTGDCKLADKVWQAQEAGAAALLLCPTSGRDTYAAPSGEATEGIAEIPVLSIPRTLCQQLEIGAAGGGTLSLAFSAARNATSTIENIAVYSSKGPTPSDNRIKPDIVAPGYVLSAAAGAATERGTGPDHCKVVADQGTSMATPVVAGSAALLRQYFTDGFWPTGKANPADAFVPSAALLRAMLIGGAVPIDGVEANTGLPVDPPPSSRQGFGRVHLGNSVFLAGSPGTTNLALLDRVPIKQGSQHEYRVQATGGPLSVTLVWADYPALPAAERALIIDLDLAVRPAGLNGTLLLGNGGSTDGASQHDRENTVERVSLQQLPAGEVVVTIAGANVSEWLPLPATYALVVQGNFTGALEHPDAQSPTKLFAASPVVTSGPSGLTNTTTATFEFGTRDGSPGGGYQCSLHKLAMTQGQEAAEWNQTNCNATKTYTGLPNGSYEFRVQGELGITASRFFEVDADVPAVAWRSTAVIDGSTTSGGNATGATEFNGTDSTGVRFTCTLTASNVSTLQPGVVATAGNLSEQAVPLGQPFPCSSPLTLRWLLPAAWQLEVVGRDAVGNAAPPLRLGWTVALEAGAGLATRFTSGPFGVQRADGLPAFTWVVLRAGGQALPADKSSFECSLKSQGQRGDPVWFPCTSPHALQGSDLRLGQHTFRARLAGSTAESGTAVSTFQLIASGICPPPLLAPATWACAGPTSAAARSTECGALGQKCCEVQQEDADGVYEELYYCGAEELFCLYFSSDETEVTSPTSDTPKQLSLCVPRPTGCGDSISAPCCPANNQTWGLTHPAFCNLANDTAICVPTNLAEPDAYFEPAERRLTLEQYQALKKDPSNTGVLDFFQWGTCTERAEALQVAGLPECGEPGGPCGPELCSQGNRTCPDGYVCGPGPLNETLPQLLQWQTYSVCTELQELPTNCGEVGQKCCPSGIYPANNSDGYVQPMPGFCWAADVYCSTLKRLLTGELLPIAASKCLRVPKFKVDCGGPGQPCCPVMGDILSDKLDRLPFTPCQDGTVCEYNVTQGGTPTCVPNPPNCGRLGEPCCRWQTSHGITFYKCFDQGSYCPRISLASNAYDPPDQWNSAGPPDTTCRPCQKQMDLKYQDVCNIGGNLPLTSEEESELQQLESEREQQIKGTAAAPSPGPGPT